MAVSPDVKPVSPHEGFSRLWSPSATFCLNPDRTIAAVNKPAKWLWARSAEDLLGSAFHDLYLTDPKKVDLYVDGLNKVHRNTEVAFQQTFSHKNFTHFPIVISDPSYGDQDSVRRYNAWIVNLSSQPDMGFIVEYRPIEQFKHRSRRTPDLGIHRYHKELETKAMLGDEVIDYVDFQNDSVESLIKLQAPNTKWNGWVEIPAIVNEIGHIRYPLPLTMADAQLFRDHEKASENAEYNWTRFFLGERLANFLRLVGRSERLSEEEAVRNRPVVTEFNRRSVIYDRTSIKLDQEDWWDKTL